MTDALQRATPIRRLRWFICGVLFFSTVINYIDRQTLNVLAPYIKTQYHWSNTDFAWLFIAFRAAYALGTVSGRFLDRVGTRVGLSFTMAFYSCAAMLTSLATGFKSLFFFRFLLGAGESANWPGATKAVSEWFPKRESGWAVALFDSGSSIGGAIAPWLVLNAYSKFGSWRPVFLVTGSLGFIWLLLFRWLYRRPEEHPRLSVEERDYIFANRADASAAKGDRTNKLLGYRTLLKLPQTWGVIIGKMLTDPVWFFIGDWFAIFLVSKGYKLEQSLMAFWVPFLAADVGNFFGGWLSSHLINRGWRVGAARKLVVVICGLGMLLLIPAAFINSYFWLVACFAISTLSYSAFSTMVLNLPADLYPTGSVASVSGMSFTGASIATIVAYLLTGYVADHFSFRPILVTAGLIPLVATIAVVVLVRNNRATREGVVNPI